MSCWGMSVSRDTGCLGPPVWDRGTCYIVCTSTDTAGRALSCTALLSPHVTAPPPSPSHPLPTSLRILYTPHIIYYFVTYTTWKLLTYIRTRPCNVHVTRMPFYVTKKPQTIMQCLLYMCHQTKKLLNDSKINTLMTNPPATHFLEAVLSLTLHGRPQCIRVRSACQRVRQTCNQQWRRSRSCGGK